MFFMPWVRDVVALRKPTAQNPCRRYTLRHLWEIIAKVWISAVSLIRLFGISVVTS